MIPTPDPHADCKTRCSLWCSVPPKQPSLEAIQAANLGLSAAALIYAMACDEQNYPALHLCVEDLKLAARKLRWATLGIEGDPRKKPDTRAASARHRQRKHEKKTP